jgi:hypothetical protein
MEELVAVVSEESVPVHAPNAMSMKEMEKMAAASADSPSKPPSLALGPLLDRAIMALKKVNDGMASGGC